MTFFRSRLGIAYVLYISDGQVHQRLSAHVFSSPDSRMSDPGHRLVPVDMASAPSQPAVTFPPWKKRVYGCKEVRRRMIDLFSSIL